MKSDRDILDKINKSKKESSIDIFFVLIMTLCFLIGCFAGKCSAQEFLITNYDLTNQNYTLNKIHKFIKKFPNNKLTDKQIYFINWQCRAWSINPLPIFATMEKEVSIISVPDNIKSYNWREHRCMGYGLIKSIRSEGKKYYQYGFFEVQIHQGVRILRRLFNEYKDNYRLKIDDGEKIILITNAASYALYRYTPFTKGNNDFKKIYQKFKIIWDGIN